MLLVNIFDGFFIDKNLRCHDCNVLFITTDSLRADHVGAYGYYRNTTPTIDSLAEKGLLFQNFITPSSITFISLPTMIAGTNGQLVSLDQGAYMLVRNDFITLPEALSKHNYTSFGVINNDISFTNVLKGFNHTGVFDAEHDGLITNHSIKLLRQKPSDKFFMWIHYWVPHSPYNPPIPYNKYFEFNDSPEILSSEEVSDHAFIGNHSREFYIAQYDGYIRFIDSEINKLLGFLKENNLYENTLIILSSDHGEILTERKPYFVHGSLYDTDIHAPLIIFHPGMKESRVVRPQVRGIDIYPTIMDFLGLEYPSSIQGKSFYNSIIKDNYHERTAFMRTDEFRVYGFRNSDWKYIYPNELYNLRDDSEETNNLFGTINLNETNLNIPEELLSKS